MYALFSMIPDWILSTKELFFCKYSSAPEQKKYREGTTSIWDMFHQLATIEKFIESTSRQELTMNTS